MPKTIDKTHLFGRPVTERPGVNLPTRTNLQRDGAGRPDASFIASIHNPLMCVAVSAPPGTFLFSELKTQIREHYEELKIPLPDLSPLDKAFEMGSLAHAGQLRESGVPYINHPLEGALEMVKGRWVEIPALEAFILHDSVEDTADKPEGQMITVARIKEEMGEEVASLVDGLTKWRKLGKSKEVLNVENYKKFMGFASRDIRVAILKLFDRLVNSRTFDKLPAARARKNALETLAFYVPLAHGLGLWQIKNELEENSNRILDEKTISLVKGIREQEEKRMQKGNRIDEVIGQVRDRLAKRIRKKDAFKIEYTPNASSHIYRKYRENAEMSIGDEMHVFVVEVEEKYCDRVIRGLHDLYTYIPNTLADYISNALPNKYRALHTIVFVPGVGNVMFKVMSPEMRRLADRGILHFYSPQDPGWYKFIGEKYPWFGESVAYVRTEEILREEEVREVMQGAAFTVEVFTDKGEVKRLPIGSTPLDFAYKIHTILGYETVSARVQRGRLTLVDKDLSLELQRFDRVEIFRQSGRKPSIVDLEHVNTLYARGKIKEYLRSLPRETSEAAGLQYLREAMKREWIKIVEKTGDGEVREEQQRCRCYLSPEDLGATKKIKGRTVKIFERLFKRLDSSVAKGYRILNEWDLFYLMGIGELSAQKVIEILLKYIEQAPRRWPRILKIVFETQDKPGILAAIANPIANLNLNIKDVKTRYDEEEKKAVLTIRVRVFSNIQEIQVKYVVGEYLQKEGGRIILPKIGRRIIPPE